jgi:transposase InsO family protein
MPQMARWLALIEQFDYTVEHRPGLKHGNADALSRRGEAVNDDEAEDAETEVAKFQLRSVTASSNVEPTDPLAREKVLQAQSEDEDLGPIVRLRLQQQEQPSIVEFLAMSEQTKILWSMWERLEVREGLIYRRYYSKGGKTDSLQLLVPAGLQQEAIQRCHTGMTGGHLGTKKTLDQVQRRFFWLQWRRDTAMYCRRCPECCSYHRGKLPRTAPLQPIIAGAPFERLCIDLTGPHCRSDKGNSWILTCTDPFTKWVEAFPLRNKEAETVARVLVDQVFTRFGVPLALLSDRGKEVDGNIMRAVCQLMDIDKLRTTAYKASTNAAIERFHKTLNSRETVTTD